MTRNRRPGALDIGIAALAAASAGFVAFAMPEALFSGLVEASRLPEFIAAAQPPLGQTARFATVAAAALLTFLLVYALMRALDRRPAGPRPIPLELADEEEQTPRLRRADTHPDAPARRPLLAGRELGEPVEEPTVEAPEPPRESFADLEPQPLPGFLVAEQPKEELVLDDPEPEPEPDAEPEPAPEPLELDQEASLEEAGAQPSEAPEGEPKESVTDLMQRLERGLGRREKAQALARPEPELPPQPPAEDRVGHRLRSAINDLQKMAARGG